MPIWSYLASSLPALPYVVPTMQVENLAVVSSQIFPRAGHLTDRGVFAVGEGGDECGGEGLGEDDHVLLVVYLDSVASADER